MIEKVKVTNQNGTITKEIQKKDLPQYVAMGWKEKKEYNFNQKFTKVN